MTLLHGASYRRDRGPHWQGRCISARGNTLVGAEGLVRPRGSDRLIVTCRNSFRRRGNAVLKTEDLRLARE
jgi:hypothetical protein